MRALILAGLVLVPGVLPGQVKLSGFAEVSYAYSGHSSGDSMIVGRLYDRLQNRFTLNALGVVLEQAYDPAKRSAGFHTEVLFGQNATVIKSGGGALDIGTQGDIPQLYVTLNLPTANGSGVQFKAGRIPTLMGLEVIETAANPNASEGNQFVYVENFTGFGASVEARLNRLLDVQLRLINGWDQVSDNNHRKSLMGRVGISPMRSPRSALSDSGGRRSRATIPPTGTAPRRCSGGSWARSRPGCRLTTAGSGRTQRCRTRRRMRSGGRSAAG